MNRIIDLPNPLESAPEAGRPAAAAFVPQPGAAAVGASSLEVEATNAPGMARDVIEIPDFLQRNPDNTFRFPVTSEA